jgi:hypothetical protein
VIFFVACLLWFSALAPGQKPPEGALTGEITGTEAQFGNLLSNVSASKFLKLGYKFGDNVQILIAGKPITIPFVVTFSDVPRDKPLLYINTNRNVTIAVNQGSAQKFFNVTPPASLVILKK